MHAQVRALASHQLALDDRNANPTSGEPAHGRLTGGTRADDHQVVPIVRHRAEFPLAVAGDTCEPWRGRRHPRRVYLRLPPGMTRARWQPQRNPSTWTHSASRRWSIRAMRRGRCRVRAGDTTARRRPSAGIGWHRPALCRARGRRGESPALARLVEGHLDALAILAELGAGDRPVRASGSGPPSRAAWSSRRRRGTMPGGCTARSPMRRGRTSSPTPS